MKYNLGSVIREKRIEKGLTLTQFGALIDVDSGALSRVENGKELLNKKVLQRLAPVLDTSYEELAEEWYSEKIALEIFRSKCSERIHALIEEKLKIIKSRNLTQGNLGL